MSYLATSLRRDHLAVLFSLLGLTVLAWVVLVRMAVDMSGMPVAFGGVPMGGVPTGAGFDFALMFAMWAVMMVGMMVPSATPMILMFTRTNRNNRNKDEPFVPTAYFVAGYIVVWSGFGLAVTVLQWALQNVGLLSPMLVGSNAVFAGLVLIAAGLYQWTPFKNACLQHCQTPLGFLMTRWRDGAGGALRMGFEHGAYCVGCCWMLMALLFVGGVMNLLWVAVLAAFVLLEKLSPPGPWFPRISGTALMAWGGWILVANF